MHTQIFNISSLRSNELGDIALKGRRDVTVDPAGYALQTTEAFLLKHDRGKRVYFSAPELALLELSPQIAKLPRERERRQVMLELITPARANDTYRAYIATKVPYLVHFLSLRERMRLLAHVLTWTERRAKAAMAFSLVRSAKDKNEMFSMVTEKRAKQLLKLKHKELREIVAKVILMRHLKQLSLPQGLSRKVSARVIQEPKKARQLVRERLKGLYDSVKEHLSVIESHPRLARTRSAKELSRSLKEALTILSPHVARNGTPARHQLSRYEGAQLVALIACKVRAELDYGVWFATGRATPKSPSWRWTIPEIKQGVKALKEIGEGLRLMTPKLHRFERLSRRDGFGFRAPSGIIQLTDEGRRSRSFSKAFGGKNYAHITLLHEIGHAIQIGASQEFVSYSRETGRITAPADPMFDFPAFCDLSGWRCVTEQPWKCIFAGEAVDINGAMYPLYRSTNYQGEPAVFVDMDEEGRKHLLIRHPNAEFPVRSAARFDPWEDWAESFTEYMLEPDRFMVFAPEKFLFFHVHFRRYSENSDIIVRLHEILEDRVDGVSLP